MTKTFVPHDYQQEALEHLYRTPRAALWAPMGGGKTAVTLTALDTLSLVEDVYPALVLAPLRVARSVWVDEVRKWQHTQHLRVVVVTGSAAEREAALKVPADIYCCNYDNLSWLVDHYKGKWPFKTVIADECFAAGTPVLTPMGSVPIEQLAAGDLVLSHLGPRKITRVYRSETKCFNLVTLKTSDGGQIVATGDHPFFTDAGWLPARACRGRRLYGRHCLPDLRDDIYTKQNPSARASAQGAHSVLLPELSNSGDVSLQRITARNVSRFNVESPESAWPEFVELWGAMVGGLQEAVVGSAQRAAVSGKARRERDWDVPYRSPDSAFAAAGFYLELCRTVGERLAWLSTALQIRLRESADKSVLGSGWAIPPYRGSGGRARREENQSITVLGVEGVSHSERGCVVPVFNIEVEGASTYFAGGVLVHNCTRLKSFRIRQGGKRAGALGKVAHTLVNRFIGLTGTPAPKGLVDLWGQTWFLDKGERLGKTFSAFEQRWFRKSFDGFSLEPFPHAQQEIEALLKDICLTVKGLPVEEPIVNPIYVDLPPSARAIYDQMEKEAFAVIDEQGVHSVNAGAKINRLLQIANGAIYVDDEQWREVHRAKIEALESIVEEAAGMPVLVAYQYKHDLERLTKHFRGSRVLDTDPQTIRDWNAGRIRILFAHGLSAGHGLDMADGGNILARFGLGWDLEIHMQILERIGPQRQKQAGYDRPVFDYPIIARNTIEERATWPSLMTKRSRQEMILAAMRRS